MELVEQADEIFLDFARRFDLVYERKTYGDGDSCIFFGQQVGLQEKVWMCFGNVDEISYGVGEFFGGSAFPCPAAFDDFIENMNGILSGEFRIRYGMFRSVLEKQVGESWTIKARYSGLKWHGFRFQIFVNSPQTAS